MALRPSAAPRSGREQALPLNAAGSAHTLPPPSLPYAARRGRVLVIDDEPEIVHMIRRELGSEHEVLGVTSCHTGLAMLSKDSAFDLILCDLMMPVMNGMQLYAELERTKPALVKRIVFMTGGAFTQAALKFLATVPNPNVSKPIEADTLSKVVRMGAGPRRQHAARAGCGFLSAAGILPGLLRLP